MLFLRFTLIIETNSPPNWIGVLLTDGRKLVVLICHCSMEVCEHLIYPVWQCGLPVLLLKALFCEYFPSKLGAFPFVIEGVFYKATT